MAALDELITYCNNRLDIGSYEDYCPNGLQVEASVEVNHVVSGVTASLALIQAAAAAGADLLLTHHGYFWKNEALPLSGMKGRRIQALYQHGISLAAYHLPLDAHPAIGNNALLGGLLGCAGQAIEGENGLLWGAEFPEPMSVDTLLHKVRKLTGREPLLLSGGDHPVRRLAWCTGGAQAWLDKAADLGFDAYLTGEASEASFHVAAERHIHFIGAGHHATERYGIQALGRELEDKFNIKHEFIDIVNPV